MYGCRLIRPLCRLAVVALIVAPARPAVAGETPDAAASVPLEAFAPSFLGMYRKIMRIEREIAEYSAKYGVDASLAKAVCMYESGGNANLTSSAGANGYFQVMPSTFRAMRVPTNIEAGIKYLGQLVRQLGREDYALAGYNGGPGRVATRRPMPLESLQYVIGVGSYRAVLKAYEPSVRMHAERLSLAIVEAGEDWWALSRRLSLPVTQLKLHNPFLAARALRAGNLIAYPPAPRADVLAGDDRSRYRTRLGDNYLTIAYALDVDVDLLRDTNHLWRLQPLLQDTELIIPRDPDAAYSDYTVRAGDTVVRIAGERRIDPWELVRDNHLWDENVREGMVLRVRQLAARQPSAPSPAPPAFELHRVRAGDTLIALARRYGTTVRAIQSANALGRRTLVRVGEQLRIPRR